VSTVVAAILIINNLFRIYQQCSRKKAQS